MQKNEQDSPLETSEHEARPYDSGWFPCKATIRIPGESQLALPAGPVPDCPRCDGSGEEEVMDGDGPDAHPIMVNCTHCGGIGSLSAAYKHLLSELAAANSKYLEVCGKIYFASIEPSPAVAQPVADERALREVLEHVEEVLDTAIAQECITYPALRQLRNRVREVTARAARAALAQEGGAA